MKNNNLDAHIVKSLYTIAKATTEVIDNQKLSQYNKEVNEERKKQLSHKKSTNIKKPTTKSQAIYTTKEHYNENEPINFFNTIKNPDAIKMPQVKNNKYKSFMQ